MRNSCLLSLAILLSAVHSLQAAQWQPSSIRPSKPLREFRGVWITTVYNINWPSKPGLSTDQQKAELIAMLDQAQKLNFNAVVLQVRGSGDSFYDSKIEPWSEYLTGTMGKAPSPYYDPLAFAVLEAHKRGLELHAWFNPFRARVPSKGSLPANHVARRYPSLVRKHGKYLWMDPGDKAAQDYTLQVMLDVVRRYDIDAVHIDDYFYPPTQTDASGKVLPFDDETTWRRYQAAKGNLGRDDWRRENVNVFVQRLYSGIKSVKPWVKFGISPPGIWRPGHPPQIKGRDVYQAIYADSRKWLQNGWCDYFAPQLYWRIDPPEQSYPVLLKWWAEQNPKGRHLWPGLNTGQLGNQWSTSEIVNQINLTRRQQGATGHIHYHMKTIKQNTGNIAEELGKLYTEPALVPASPWLSQKQPSKPDVIVTDNSNKLNLTWKPLPGEGVLQWVVQFRYGGKWQSQILPYDRTSVATNQMPEAVAVTAVNRYGLESPPAVFEAFSSR